MGKKLDLTEEELLKIAESTDTQVTETNDEVLDFVLAFNLKDGENPITSKMLYLLFKGWKKTSFSVGEFTSRLRIYLASNNRGLFYLNFNALELSKPTLKALKKPTKTTTIPGKKVHFDAFLNFFKLTKGDVWISLTDFYQIYDYWTYKRKTKKNLSKNSLLEFCKLFLNVKSDRRDHYIGVNKALLTAVEQYNYENKEKTNLKKSN